MSGWLFVIGEREGLRWVLTQQQMAFRAHVPTVRLSEGDDVVVYATRGCWHNPTRDFAQVAAIGRIASPVCVEPVDVAGEIMAAHCALDLDVVLPERAGLPFSDLLECLQLTQGRTSWGPLFRRTIVALPPADVHTISVATRKYVRQSGGQYDR